MIIQNTSNILISDELLERLPPNFCGEVVYKVSLEDNDFSSYNEKTKSMTLCLKESDIFSIFAEREKNISHKLKRKFFGYVFLLDTSFLEIQKNNDNFLVTFSVDMKYVLEQV